MEVLAFSFFFFRIGPGNETIQALVLSVFMCASLYIGRVYATAKTID